MLITPVATVLTALSIARKPSLGVSSTLANLGRMNRKKVMLWVGLALAAGILLYAFTLLATRANRPNELLQAAEYGDLATVRDLLDKGVDINTADGWSSTPMMYAAANGHDAIVELLLDRGADINAPSRMDRTPLMWAALRGHEKTVKLLLGKGARLDAQDREGKTALMLAHQEGHGSTEALLKAAEEAH